MELLHPDAKVTSLLYKGGPIPYKIVNPNVSVVLKVMWMLVFEGKPLPASANDLATR